MTVTDHIMAVVSLMSQAGVNKNKWSILIPIPLCQYKLIMILPPFPALCSVHTAMSTGTYLNVNVHERLTTSTLPLVPREWQPRLQHYEYPQPSTLSLSYSMFFALFTVGLFQVLPSKVKRIIPGSWFIMLSEIDNRWHQYDTMTQV